MEWKPNYLKIVEVVSVFSWKICNVLLWQDKHNYMFVEFQVLRLFLCFFKNLIFLRLTNIKLCLRDIFISYCCCKKLPQTWWLEITQIYYLPILEVRNVRWVINVAKIKCQQSWVHSRASGGNLCLAETSTTTPRGQLRSLVIAASFWSASIILLWPASCLLSRVLLSPLG